MRKENVVESRIHFLLSPSPLGECGKHLVRGSLSHFATLSGSSYRDLPSGALNTRSPSIDAGDGSVSRKPVSVFRVLVGAFLLYGGLPTMLQAQPTVVAVDLAKAKITWTWTQGAGGPAEKWRVFCGPTAGTYPLTVELPDPAARAIPLGSIIQTDGAYVCMVRAVNSFGASPDSPTVALTAGKAPVAAAAVKIESQ